MSAKLKDSHPVVNPHDEAVTVAYKIVTQFPCDPARSCLLHQNHVRRREKRLVKAQPKRGSIDHQGRKEGGKGKTATQVKRSKRKKKEC